VADCKALPVEPWPLWPPATRRAGPTSNPMLAPRLHLIALPPCGSLRLRARGATYASTPTNGRSLMRAIAVDRDDSGAGMARDPRTVHNGHPNQLRRCSGLVGASTAGVTSAGPIAASSTRSSPKQAGPVDNFRESLEWGDVFIITVVAQLLQGVGVLPWESPLNHPQLSVIWRRRGVLRVQGRGRHSLAPRFPWAPGWGDDSPARRCP
jgi:hypothetical protein